MFSSRCPPLIEAEQILPDESEKDKFEDLHRSILV